MSTASDEAYQARILPGVSRTFALTIPQLPPRLCKLVTNAYLLCRITDTIEDERALDARQKRQFAEQFVDAVAGRSSAERFAATLYPLLSSSTLEAERDLVRNSATIVRVTRSFTPFQRAVLERCVTIMGEGMAWFQANQSEGGLPDLPHLDAYCYYVAGVVGEMLTELFCDYSVQVARNRPQLLSLAASFGQGLQMTNILKDIWEDRSRGACWLPRDVFEEDGFELNTLSPQHHGAAFARGLQKLMGIAHGHLRDALTYTLLLPANEPGLRKFCLWAIGLALLTLRKINGNLSFTSGDEVKVTRRAVSGTILVTNMVLRKDRALHWLFDLVATGLPAAGATAYPGVSRHGWDSGASLLPGRTAGPTPSSSGWIAHE